MKISSMLMGVGLAFVFSASFANSTTSLDSNWRCTTNASTSSVASEKAADEQMANNKTSAANAFAMAQKNCRDCNKITCELND